MAIAFRQDSKQHTHQIWVQEQPASCAVAAIWMARCQARQMTFAETEWELAWRLYRSVVMGLPQAFSSAAWATPPPMSIDARAASNDQKSFANMFGRGGTFGVQVAQALRNDGLTVYHDGPDELPKQLSLADVSFATPAIVLLGWYKRGKNGLERDGGHFIVAADRIGGRVVFLDPWDGSLSEIRSTGIYRGNGVFEEVIYVAR